MELMEAICQRRSIRQYRDQPVNDQLVQELIAAACLSPSAKNRQPWKFMVLRGAEKDQVAQLMEAWCKCAGAGHTPVCKKLPLHRGFHPPGAGSHPDLLCAGPHLGYRRRALHWRGSRTYVPACRGTGAGHIVDSGHPLRRAGDLPLRRRRRADAHLRTGCGLCRRGASVQAAKKSGGDHTAL